MKRALVAGAVALALSALAGCVHQGPAADASAVTVKAAIPARLSHNVMPERYTLELHVDPSQERFSGHTEIAVTMAEASDMIRIHGRDMTVKRVSARLADGREVAGSWNTVSPTGMAELHFPEILPAGKATLVFDYDAPFNHTNEGLYLTEYAGAPYAFTQFEDIDARRAFPSFDEPGFKARYDLSLVIRDSDKAVGNMPIVGEEKLGNGSKRVHFMETPRLSSYLVAFAVGPLDIVDGPTIPANSLRSYAVPLRGVAAKGEGAKLKFALEHAGKQVETLEQYFGIPYPFAKLDLLAVPDFNAGAMENPGAITFRDTLLLLGDKPSIDRQRSELSVTSHELAHQWFGDLVTPSWWTDIWLNEAFATWMGNKAAQRAFPEFAFGLDTENGAIGAMGSDSLASQREIRQTINRDEEIHQAFDGITYRKGGGVLSMFESFVGEDVFQKGVHNYLVKHSWNNATAEDFIASVAEAAGKPALNGAFMSYLTQSGVPMVEVTPACANHSLNLTLKQSRYLPVGSKGDSQRQWGVPFCATVYAGGKSEKSCELMTKAEQTMAIPVASCDAVVMPNSDGGGYYRWSLPDADWKALLARLPKLPAREALSTVDSLTAAYNAGRIDNETYLAALPQIAKRHEREILSKPIGVVEFMIERLHQGEDAKALQDRVARIYRPLLRRLGWVERAGDDANTRGLRGDLVRFLAEVLEQKYERERLVRWGKRYAGFGGKGKLNPKAVPEAYAGMALTVAVQDLGQPFLDHLVGLLAKTDDGLQRSRLLYAIASTHDPKLLDRSHKLFFADKMRTNERFMLLASPFYEKRTEQAQLDWFLTDFDAVKARLPEQTRPYIPRYLSDFCSQGDKTRIAQFLDKNMADVAGAKLAIDSTLESIELCSVLVEKQSARMASK